VLAVIAATLIAGATVMRITGSDLPREIAIGTSVQAISDAPFSRDPGPVSYPDEVELVASYSAVDGSLTDTDVDPEHAAAWARVEAVIPPAWRDRIAQFTIMSEGSANIVAIVHRSSQLPDDWVLSVDIDDLAAPDLLEGTLIHELGHMLSLGADDFAFTSDSCDDDTYTVAMELGCAQPDSMIARWVDAFWNGEDPVFDTESYVSRYATTSPHEDFAETFMAWVLQPAPAAGSTVNAKFAFLDASSDAVSIRDEILSFASLADPRDS
jgi:hypothetical protein